jgi:hypothetical protein
MAAQVHKILIAVLHCIMLAVAVVEVTVTLLKDKAALVAAVTEVAAVIHQDPHKEQMVLAAEAVVVAQEFVPPALALKVDRVLLLSVIQIHILMQQQLLVHLHSQIQAGTKSISGLETGVLHSNGTLCKT